MRVSKIILLISVLCMSRSTHACLNDSELPDFEREFRSQYLDNPPLTSQLMKQPRDQVWMMSLQGFALMFGAVGLTWVTQKRKHQS